MKKIGACIGLCMILSGLLPGCREREQNHYVDPIPERLKEYGVFQAGSYWIFKNEKSGLSDSVFMKSAPRFFIIHSGDGPWFEICRLSYDSSLIAEGGMDWGSYSLSFTNRYGGLCLCAKSFQPGYFEGDFKNLDYFDSLEVNGNMFYDVIHTQYRSIGFDRDTLVYNYFLAKSAGLIKFNFRWNSSDTTWSVIRYHAIR